MLGPLIADVVERRPNPWSSRFSWRARVADSKEAARAMRYRAPQLPKKPTPKSRSTLVVSVTFEDGTGLLFRRHVRAPSHAAELQGTASNGPLKESWADDILSLAAQQAYYFVFALFPALLTLISIASFFPVANLVDEIVSVLGRFAPPDVLTIIADQIKKISQSDQGGVLTLAFLLTIWSSSGAMVSIITTLNAAYDITEGRPFWRVRLTAIALTLGMSLFVLVSIALVLVGPTSPNSWRSSLHLGTAFKWAWWVLQWPVVFLLVATGIGLVYYFAPDAKQDWIWITPGSILATVLWVARLARVQGVPQLLPQLQRDLRHARRLHRRPDVVLPLGPGHPGRGRDELRDRARVAIRESSGRESAWREEDDRPDGEAGLRRAAGERGNSDSSVPRRRELRSGQETAPRDGGRASERTDHRRRGAAPGRGEDRKGASAQSVGRPESRPAAEARRAA